MLKSEVLRLLKCADGYISGQAICGELEVSRTAVWKVIRQLRSEGYVIRAVQNKGYYLLEKPDVLSKEELEGAIDSEWAGKTVYYYSVTDSTNSCIKALAETGAKQGTLVVADMQSAGKGRRGRSWYSEAGSGVWMSILLRPEFEPNQASMITLVAALAAAKAIRDVSGLDARIKWPNDIVINGKKVCGILTEMSLEADYIRYVVCGIGINVNHKEFPEDIRATATSLMLESGEKVSRIQLISELWKHFEKYYELFCADGDLKHLKAEYNSILVNKDKQVRVLEPKGEWSGKATGINNKGELLVETEDGSVNKVYSGEVSVRGIYGYI